MLNKENRGRNLRGLVVEGVFTAIRTRQVPVVKDVDQGQTSLT